jgi:CRISPR/Cas system-associated exonuclease Cas4 (RecB family)
MIATARHLSFSQLRTFVECPRKWHYEKVVQLEPERVPVSLAFGCAVHDAVAVLNEAAILGEQIDAAKAFDRAWAPYVKPSAVPLAADDDEAENLAAKGRALVTMYQAPPGIVAVEQGIEVELDPTLPRLVGRIDLIRQVADGLVVADVKTSSTKVLSDTDMLAAQLGLYGMAYPAVRSEAIVLFKGKNPVQAVQNVDPWPVKRLRTWAIEINAAMEAGIRFAHRGRNCRTCQYRDQCGKEG